MLPSFHSQINEGSSIHINTTSEVSSARVKRQTGAWRQTPWPAAVIVILIYYIIIIEVWVVRLYI